MISQNRFSQIIKKMLIFASCVSVIFFSYGISQELTVNDVIQKNIEARGGISNWAAVKTIKITGTYVNFSDATPFTVWRQRPDLYRFDSTRLNMFIVHAYDGKQTWWVNPLFGPPNDKPVVIPSKGNLDKTTLRERFFEPVFWNPADKGNDVVLEGKTEMDDHNCYKLKVTLVDSSIEYWYINSETFLEVGMTGYTYDFGLKTEIEMFFSDFREKNGIKLPYLVESEYGIRYRVMEIETLEINPVIKPSVFSKPDSSTWKSNLPE